MKAKTIDNSPHGWDTCIYDNEDCPMGYYVDDLPDKERADKYTNIFNLELSSHVAKETEKLQAEIDYIKREKLAIHLLIDEITDGDCLKQSKAKLSGEIVKLKAEVERLRKDDGWVSIDNEKPLPDKACQCYCPDEPIDVIQIAFWDDKFGFVDNNDCPVNATKWKYIKIY